MLRLLRSDVNSYVITASLLLGLIKFFPQIGIYRTNNMLWDPGISVDDRLSACCRNEEFARGRQVVPVDGEGLL